MMMVTSCFGFHNESVLLLSLARQAGPRPLLGFLALLIVKKQPASQPSKQCICIA